jgi:ribosomal protein S18 acetylase RimI-like enzyme
MSDPSQSAAHDNPTFKPAIAPSSTFHSTVAQPELAAFLQRLDTEFDPPLSTRTDIGDYATKMIAKATLVVARREDQLVGVAAAYCNDTSSKIAYMTYLGVAPEARGGGLGGQLVTEIIRLATQQGMRSLELQTDAGREAAVRFYLRLGFHVVASYERFGGFHAVRLKRTIAADSTGKPATKASSADEHRQNPL